MPRDQYHYALEEEAVLFFASLSSRSRSRLLRCFDVLASNPFISGDLREPGATGRAYELSVFDNTVITWWADHAVREVHIVRLEQAD